MFHALLTPTGDDAIFIPDRLLTELHSLSTTAPSSCPSAIIAAIVAYPLSNNPGRRVNGSSLVHNILLLRTRSGCRHLESSQTDPSGPDRPTALRRQHFICLLRLR